MASHLCLDAVLERLVGDDCGLSSDKKSDFVGDGICTYLPEAEGNLSEAVASGGALEEEEDGSKEEVRENSGAASPALSAGHQLGQYRYVQSYWLVRSLLLLYSICTLLDDDEQDADDEDRGDGFPPSGHDTSGCNLSGGDNGSESDHSSTRSRSRSRSRSREPSLERGQRRGGVVGVDMEGVVGVWWGKLWVVVKGVVGGMVGDVVGVVVKGVVGGMVGDVVGW